jgi:hypothetical protein
MTDHCKCGHPLSVHTRNVNGDAMRTDFPSGQEPKGDIFSDKPLGESGCSDCPCRQWKPLNY